MSRLGGKVAIVTGGGGGIGAAVSAVLGRAEGGAADPLSLDVTDRDSIAAAVGRARELAGPVDWLVANAGIAVSAPLSGDGHDELCTRHLEINYHGARRVFEALLPDLRERAGRAVMMASSAALQGYPYIAAYAASKHALLGYARSAALELAGANVGVNVVCPYYVDTPLLDVAVKRLVEKTGRTPEDARAFFAAENPGGVLITAEEVAEATLDLLRCERTGVVVELVGGARRELESGPTLEAAREPGREA